MLRNVVALVGQEVAAFELGVLAEVFGLDRTSQGLPGYEFAVAAATPGLVPTSSGFAVHVEHGLSRLEEADLIAVPAWTAAPVEAPREVVEALHRAVERGARVLSICSGAFLLAAAGLLDGRRAATHWRYAPVLAARHPAVQVDPDVLYVDDGCVVTSAGTAAAIDVCLHLVRQEHGAAVANAIARRMVVPAHRHGGQAQFIEPPSAAVVDDADSAMGDLLEWARRHLHEPLPVRRLAGRALMSERTFVRRFHECTGATPHRWLLEQRLLLAEQLLESSDLPVDQVAARVGMGSADTLRHHFARRRRTSPQAYRHSFRARADASGRVRTG
ncbi:helix-turn-helix domain-containing protein [Cellulomonas sp. NPDC057328]|uniref:helix-turn-helix domain-containing protein n=1 Tax=Cellulomonas sp. NPDC057328 TaxID=3346101 RepID=UPI00363ABFBE